MSHGDYATNVALVLSKSLEIGSKEIAEKIVAYINEHKGPDIAAVSIAGAGFINFSLASDFFVNVLGKVTRLKTFIQIGEENE